MSNPTAAEPPTTTIAKPWYRNPWFLAFVLGIITVTAMRPLLRHVPPPPPPIGQLPSFRLQDQHGRPFGSQELSGQVWVASFFSFDAGPQGTQHLTALRQLARGFDDRRLPIRMVSVLMDGTDDRAPSRKQQLQARADQLGAVGERWILLAGPRAEVTALVVRGIFGHAAAPPDRLDSPQQIATLGRLAIIDQRGRLRGIYRAEGDGLSEVFNRAQHVLADRQ